VAVFVCFTYFSGAMEKISLRQVISLLQKGGSLPEWLSIEEIKESIMALKRGARNFTGTNFFSYAIIENDQLVNILFIQSNREATMLLRLLQDQGDE